MTDALRRMILLPSALLIRTVEVNAYDLSQIFYVKSGRLWMSNMGNNLIQVDTDGTTIEQLHSDGPWCVTEKGALLYVCIREHRICIIKKIVNETTTFLENEELKTCIDIHSSYINGDILVLMDIRDARRSVPSLYKITRYTEKGVKIQDIEKSKKGQRWLVWDYARIAENRNGDIIISCLGNQEVEGMNRSGEHRFTYSHPKDENPGDICTDKYGHILVAYDASIHLLDEDGKFQKILLRNSSSYRFRSLCLDDKQNLYVATERDIIKVYKYLKEE